jgi:penicillin-binding protein 1A
MQMLQAVVRQGTAVAASQMKHPFGGKTGTTNDFTDAWFIGFSPSVTCGTWIGFDDRQPLGEKETGARAALPMWMDFMRVAIANKPNEAFATAGAPKKMLDLPLSKPTDADKLVKPAKKAPDEADPDAPAGADGIVEKPASPAVRPTAAPVAPVDKPKTPAPERIAPAASSPKAATAPAKAAEEERNGVSNPPPDIN